MLCYVSLIHNYSLNGIRIKRVKVIRDLGVMFNEKLTFNTHIEYVFSKAYSMLGFVKRICNQFTNPYTLKNVYCAHVRSHLEYCSIVWRPNYSTHIAKIESIQKKFLIYALRHLHWRDGFVLPPYTSRCLLINLETLETRRDNLCVFFLYDLLSGRYDCINLMSLVNFRVPFRTTRNNALFQLSRHRTNYGDFEPFRIAQLLMNKYSNIFDYNLTRSTFRQIIRSTVVSPNC